MATWFAGPDVIKISILPTLIYKINANPIQNPRTLFLWILTNWSQNLHAKSNNLNYPTQ